MTSRLTRADVERQIDEMWDAIGSIPSTDAEGMELSGREGRRIEAELRERLAAQDRLDAAAPALLAACRSALRALRDNLEPGPMDADAKAALADAIRQATGEPPANG